MNDPIPLDEDTETKLHADVSMVTSLLGET